MVKIYKYFQIILQICMYIYIFASCYSWSWGTEWCCLILVSCFILTWPYTSKKQGSTGLCWNAAHNCTIFFTNAIIIAKPFEVFTSLIFWIPYSQNQSQFTNYTTFFILINLFKLSDIFVIYVHGNGEFDREDISWNDVAGWER